jgi:hypothetical protein
MLATSNQPQGDVRQRGALHLVQGARVHDPHRKMCNARLRGPRARREATALVGLHDDVLVVHPQDHGYAILRRAGALNRKAIGTARSEN